MVKSKEINYNTYYKKDLCNKKANHIGAFLKACKCFSELKINITRVSYNKAVDSHTLFIEVEGDKNQLILADEKLHQIGYLSHGEENSKIILVEFCLEDKSGSITEILELISKFNFNISYISSQENGSGYQHFKMGLHVSELNFEVYEGKGGHLLGEIILIDFENRGAFTGDVFINLSDLTQKQAEYNQYAPILMTSVDTDAKLCAKERQAFLQRLGVGEWCIFGGHGQKKVYSIEANK